MSKQPTRSQELVVRSPNPAIDGKAELVTSINVDGQIATEIKTAFAAAHEALGRTMRKIAACGALMLWQKAQVKHGEFGPWLRAHCFDGIEDKEFEARWRTANNWMQSAQALVDVLQIRNTVSNLPLHQLLQTDRTALSAEQQEVQDKIFTFLDGKSQRQLMLAWKEEKDKDAPPLPELDPKKAAEAAEKKAMLAFQTLRADAALHINGESVTRVPVKTLIETLGTFTDCNKRLRDLIKARGKTRKPRANSRGLIRKSKEKKS
jgi:hypothetical protein